MPHWREFLDPSAPSGAYLPWKEVARRTSLSRTTAWRLQRRDEFPRAYPISPGRVGHLECEVQAWIAARARPGGSPPPPARQAAAAADQPGASKATSAQIPKAPPPPTEEAVRRSVSPEALRLARPGRRSRRDRQKERPASQQITFQF